MMEFSSLSIDETQDNTALPPPPPPPPPQVRSSIKKISVSQEVFLHKIQSFIAMRSDNEATVFVGL
jgi:hypothetical protein